MPDPEIYQDERSTAPAEKTVINLSHLRRVSAIEAWNPGSPQSFRLAAQFAAHDLLRRHKREHENGEPPAVTGHSAPGIPQEARGTSALACRERLARKRDALLVDEPGGTPAFFGRHRKSPLHSLVHPCQVTRKLRRQLGRRSRQAVRDVRTVCHERPIVERDVRLFGDAEVQVHVFCGRLPKRKAGLHLSETRRPYGERIHAKRCLAHPASRQVRYALVSGRCRDRPCRRTPGIGRLISKSGRDRIAVRVRDREPDQCLEVLRVVTIVCVEKGYPLARRVCDAGVASRGYPRVRLAEQADPGIVEPTDLLRTVVGRAVVDHDQLPGAAGLGQHGLDRVGDVRRLVVERNDY
jgi:hypothetical protein